MTSISKNVYIDKLDYIINKKQQYIFSHVDITYINSSKEINNEVPKFKIGDTVRTSKYKKDFPKDYVPN